MIRMAPWLHPFLAALLEKVQKMKNNIENLNKFIDGAFVLARARGIPVDKPAPSALMSTRAHTCMERAVNGRESHLSMLTSVLEDLRARSAPERLPHVIEGLGDACMQLQRVMSSNQFRAVVGDSFPALAPLGDEDPRRIRVEDFEEDDHSDESDFMVASFRPPPADTLTSGGGEAAEKKKESQCRRSSSELKTEVYRLAVCSSGYKRHDLRLIVLLKKRLYIYQKSSTTNVKTIVDVETDIIDCTQLPNDVMLLTIRRKTPKGGSQEKGYFFQFRVVSMASAFFNELAPWVNRQQEAVAIVDLYSKRDEGQRLLAPLCG